MDYSISEAGKLTNRHPDSVRRAIRAGKLKATKHPTAGYRITDTDLEAWAGRPPQSADLDELETARATIEAQAAELEAARALIESRVAELEAARVQIANLGTIFDDESADLEAARVELDAANQARQAARETIETLRDQLTRERQAADAAHETQRVLTATVAALTYKLEALPPGKTRRPWLRFRSIENRPPAER